MVIIEINGLRGKSCIQELLEIFDMAGIMGIIIMAAIIHLLHEKDKLDVNRFLSSCNKCLAFSLIERDASVCVSPLNFHCQYLNS